jgi:poly-gamma-glutamate synthesis protein (capsule biosynthesis protein)
VPPRFLIRPPRGRALALVCAALSLCLFAACASPAGAPDPTSFASDADRATSTAPPSTPGEAGLTATPVAARSVTISAVGDISLAREVVDRMEADGAGYPYALVSHLLTGDIVFGNLEGALTDRGEPWPKSYNFRTPPRFAVGLAEAGFDVVSLANNHSMDYGEIGLLDTISAIDNAGLARPGVGEHIVAAWRPHFIGSAPDLRVGFIACAASPPEGSGFAIEQWEARPVNPGFGLAVCDEARMTEAIDEARVQFSDFVVVSIHAGDEYVRTPNATQRALVDAALAAGADVVLGHHAHVVQPLEQRGAQLIAWGLGNFIFDLDDVDLANIPEPRVSLILNITLTEGTGVTAWEAVPVVLDAAEDRPRPASASESAVLFEQIAP